jgi:DNA cross-link repair 1A protein
MCCYDWSLEEKARLTTDCNAANIWVVSMNQINFNYLENFKKKKTICNRVIGFQPTGWTHKPTGQTTNNPSQRSTLLQRHPFLNLRQKEGNIIYSIPYSEHSSFSELINFVQTFR